MVQHRNNCHLDCDQMLSPIHIRSCCACYLMVGDSRFESRAAHKICILAAVCGAEGLRLCGVAVHPYARVYTKMLFGARATRKIFPLGTITIMLRYRHSYTFSVTCIRAATNNFHYQLICLLFSK